MKTKDAQTHKRSCYFKPSRKLIWSRGTWYLYSSLLMHIPTSRAWLMHHPPLQGRFRHKYTYIPAYSFQTLPWSCPCCPCSMTEACMDHANIPNSRPSGSPDRAWTCSSVSPQQNSLKDLMDQSNSNTRCSSSYVTPLPFRVGEIQGL